ncbi:MAG: DUF308 domain-containing protein [Candidatus Aenigmarchaeota archaeon]|nr:DUF308 domain-containing protein [Candidatus Aenigmarchaeota archaeon]
MCLLAILDVISGVLLLFSFVPFVYNILFYLGVIIIVKGAWTVFDSLHKNIYFDGLGWIDIMSGAVMLLLFFGWPISFGWLFGILILVKGLWSVLNAM